MVHSPTPGTGERVGEPLYGRSEHADGQALQALRAAESVLEREQGQREESNRRRFGALRRFQAPNLIMLTRAVSPRIPGYQQTEEGGDVADEHEKAPGCGKQSKGKQVQKGLSVQSGLNLARLLSSLDWAKHGQCLHCTLTYHETWPETKEELAAEKSQLAAVLGRQGTGIWRLEYQRRENAEEKAARKAAKLRRRRGQGGSVLVPHWHVLLWIGSREAVVFVEWLRAWWARHAQNESEWACKVTSGSQARGTWYLAMHAAKAAQAPKIEVGKWWGYVQRDQLLEARDMSETGEILERERVWWVRLYRRATGARVRPGQGVSWFLPRAAQVRALGWIQERVLVEGHRLAFGVGERPLFGLLGK